MNTNLNNTCYELVCVCVQDAKASIALMYEHELEHHLLRIGVCVCSGCQSIDRTDYEAKMISGQSRIFSR